MKKYACTAVGWIVVAAASAAGDTIVVTMPHEFSSGTITCTANESCQVHIQSINMGTTVEGPTDGVSPLDLFIDHHFEQALVFGADGFGSTLHAVSPGSFRSVTEGEFHGMAFAGDYTGYDFSDGVFYGADFSALTGYDPNDWQNVTADASTNFGGNAAFEGLFTIVPEPATGVLLLAGISALAARSRGAR